jgi:hypothetical protein
MPKKIKQKQKQRQKQSVVVNVNLAKSSRKSSNKQSNKSNKQNLPPPVHKVYTSPIHDLTPQIFSGGKQITQPTLAEQINSYLLTIGQGRPTNVLGATPSKTVDSSQFTEPKKLPRMPLRQIYDEIDTDADVLRPNINLDTEIDTDVEPPLGVKKKSGRKKGSKNKPKPSAEDVQTFYPAEVIGVSEAEPEYSEKSQIPDEFIKKQFGLNQPQNNPNENYSVFTNPRPVDQPINEFMREQVDQPINEPPIRKTKKKKKIIYETDEENI